MKHCIAGGRYLTRVFERHLIGREARIGRYTLRILNKCARFRRLP